MLCTHIRLPNVSKHTLVLEATITTATTGHRRGAAGVAVRATSLVTPARFSALLASCSRRCDQRQCDHRLLVSSRPTGYTSASLHNCFMKYQQAQYHFGGSLCACVYKLTCSRDLAFFVALSMSACMCVHGCYSSIMVLITVVMCSAVHSIPCVNATLLTWLGILGCPCFITSSSKDALLDPISTDKISRCRTVSNDA